MAWNFTAADELRYDTLRGRRPIWSRETQLRNLDLKIERTRKSIEQVTASAQQWLTSPHQPEETRVEMHCRRMLEVERLNGVLVDAIAEREKLDVEQA